MKTLQIPSEILDKIEEQRNFKIKRFIRVKSTGIKIKSY